MISIEFIIVSCCAYVAIPRFILDSSRVCLSLASIHDPQSLDVCRKCSMKKTHDVLVHRLVWQWAWLLGLAWWTTVLALYGSSYLNVYNRIEAWWALCGVIFLSFVIYSSMFRRAHIHDKVAANTASAAVLPPSATASSSSRRAPPPCGCCWRAPHRHRVTPLLDSAVGWLLGIGVYSTLRQTFPVFDTALTQQPCDLRAVLLFGGTTTAVCFSLLVALELLTRVAEAKGLPSSGATRRRSMVARKTSRVSPLRGGVLARIVVGTHTTIRLALSFVTGKAWEATAFGLGAHASSRGEFLVTAAWWQIAAGVLAVAHTAWDLGTQREHGDSHSHRCACDVCTPEFYTRSGTADRSAVGAVGVDAKT